jgi:hypothetical protein
MSSRPTALLLALRRRLGRLHPRYLYSAWSHLHFLRPTVRHVYKVAACPLGVETVYFGPLVGSHQREVVCYGFQLRRQTGDSQYGSRRRRIYQWRRHIATMCPAQCCVALSALWNCSCDACGQQHDCAQQRNCISLPILHASASRRDTWRSPNCAVTILNSLGSRGL